MTTYLYHWTHRTRLHSINRHGLLLRFARTADGYLYAVTYTAILAGCKHVADRHKWKPRDMVLLRIEIERGECLTNPHTSFRRITVDVPRSRIMLVVPHWTPIPLTASPDLRTARRVISAADRTPNIPGTPDKHAFPFVVGKRRREQTG